MQKLTHVSKQSRSAVIVPIAAKLPFLFDTRAVAISQMSGYPVPRHALARLQKMIKLTSYKELLESLNRIYELAYLTAEVIESMDAVNLNKYQVNRLEVTTYVANIVSASKSYAPTEEEIDIISHLITSSEANPNAWVLSGGDENENLHLSFYNLYSEVLLAENPGALSVYSPSTGTITAYSQLPMFSKTTKAKTSKKGEAEDDDSKLTHSAVIHQLSACRVVDHVYQLLLDKDIWYSFLAPRKTADVTSNLDRAKTLRIFSLYIQSLLTYNQFFSLEMYLGAYDIIQEWIAAFPALETESINKIEGTIRKHDYLGAKADAASIINSLTENAKSELDALVFPKEYVAGFGFTDKVQQIESKILEIPVPATVTDIPQLSQPQFLPITSGGIVSSFDIVYDLTDLLIRGKVVAAMVDSSLQGLIPSLTRGSSKMALSGLQALNIKCSIPFKLPAAITYHVTNGVVKEVRNGTLSLDSAAAPYSRDFHETLRNKFSFRLFMDRSVANDYSHFSQPFIIDHDRATHLRNLLQYDWKALVPSYLAPGDRSLDAATIGVSIDSIKEFVAYVTGDDYEIAIRQLMVPEMRMVWATFTSGFALTYFSGNDLRELKEIKESYDPKKDNSTLRLVNGYGKPFGTTYATLESKQGTLKDDTVLIPLGRGLFLRFLNSIPVPTHDLKFDHKSFHNQRPFSYFPSNTVALPVDKWVKGDGLWHMALTPIHENKAIPVVKFTPRYAFANVSLYLNMDAFFKPASPSPTRENVSIPLVKEAWSLDRFQYWTEYIHFGAYGTKLVSLAPQEDTELVADTIKKIEQQIEKDTSDAATSNKDAGRAELDVAKRADNEVKEATSARNIKDMSADDEKPVI